MAAVFPEHLGDAGLIGVTFEIDHDNRMTFAQGAHVQLRLVMLRAQRVERTEDTSQQAVMFSLCVDDFNALGTGKHGKVAFLESGRDQFIHEGVYIIDVVNDADYRVIREQFFARAILFHAPPWRGPSRQARGKNHAFFQRGPCGVSSTTTPAEVSSPRIVSDAAKSRRARAACLAAILSSTHAAKSASTFLAALRAKSMNPSTSSMRSSARIAASFASSETSPLFKAAFASRTKVNIAANASGVFRSSSSPASKASIAAAAMATRSDEPSADAGDACRRSAKSTRRRSAACASSKPSNVKFNSLR